MDKSMQVEAMEYIRGHRDPSGQPNGYALALMAKLLRKYTKLARALVFRQVGNGNYGVSANISAMIEMYDLSREIGEDLREPT